MFIDWNGGYSETFVWGWSISPDDSELMNSPTCDGGFHSAASALSLCSFFFWPNVTSWSNSHIGAGLLSEESMTVLFPLVKFCTLIEEGFSPIIPTPLNLSSSSQPAESVRAIWPLSSWTWTFLEVEPTRTFQSNPCRTTYGYFNWTT